MNTLDITYRELYEGLLYEQQKRGYKDGWASITYSKVTGGKDARRDIHEASPKYHRIATELADEALAEYRGSRQVPIPQSTFRDFKQALGLPKSGKVSDVEQAIVSLMNNYIAQQRGTP